MLVIEGHAPRPPEGGDWHTFTTEDRTGTEYSSAIGVRSVQAPDECINWVSRLDMERKSHESSGIGLLRKEVIQPHLPVRLPCYDFTPIANPTFDSSLPEGLGHWLRVLPTFVV